MSTINEKECHTQKVTMKQESRITLFHSSQTLMSTEGLRLGAALCEIGGSRIRRGVKSSLAPN